MRRAILIRGVMFRMNKVVFEGFSCAEKIAFLSTRGEPGNGG